MYDHRSTRLFTKVSTGDYVPCMAQDTPSRHKEQFIVRFPDGMRDRLKEEAAKNGRSMNSEIIARLEASFGPEMSPEELRKLVFSGNATDEDVERASAPEDVLVAELQKAVSAAIQKKLVDLVDAGLVTMIFDIERPEAAPSFYKPSKRFNLRDQIKP